MDFRCVLPPLRSDAKAFLCIHAEALERSCALALPKRPSRSWSSGNLSGMGPV